MAQNPLREKVMKRSLVCLTWCLTALNLTSVFSAEPTGPIAETLKSSMVAQFAKAPGYSEGPTWRDGEVFFCSNGLQKVDREDKTTVNSDLGPAGTYLKADGSILICDNKHKALLELTSDGKLFVLADAWDGKPLESLNDVTVDKAGNIYWTDPANSGKDKPIGSIFRLSPEGKVDRVATGMAFPNGLEVDPASKFLYIIESQTQKILKCTLPTEGAELGKPEEFYDLGGSGGDGCAFDDAGNLWVADFHRPETKHGRITVLSPEAKVLGYLDMPTKVVSNITFGGKEHDEIFCTTGEPDGVFTAKVGVRGFKGHPGVAQKRIRELK